YRLQLLENSDLSQTLVLSLATVHHRPDIKLQLLQTLRLLSVSDLNCALMLRARGAATVCLHMNESESFGPVLFHSTEILWNLLERGNKHHVMAQLSTMECLVSLKEAFLHQLMTAVHHPELKLRNDLLVITTLISENSNTLLIVNPQEENVILAVLLLTKERQEKWSLAQTKELQLQALLTLCSLAPLLLDEYMSYHGNAFVLSLLGLHTQEGQRLSLQLLTALTSLGEEIVNQDLCDQGAIGLLMQVEGSADEEDAVALEMKSDIQLILSALCDTDMHRKELFGSEGVEMVVHFLKKGGDRFYSGLGHNKLIISTVDCVRSCIVGCYTTEDFFLAKNGVCLLLDLLCVILATLLELCDNPNMASHVRTWRDRDGQTAPRVLLQAWRDEEAELEVQRSQDGCITDPKKPISHKLQEDLRSLCLDTSTSAAILELEENLRSKIYSIFCALGFHDLPGLSPEDYVTLSIIRRYLDFKVAEVWDEVNEELARDGIRPVTPDRQSLETLCRISEETAKRVIEEQSSILQRREEEDLSLEQLMYSEVKSQQKELVAKSWNDYVSKTSNYEVLKVCYTFTSLLMMEHNLLIFNLTQTAVILVFY
uniref:Cilia- and flagella-associated protein 69 ARM repeats domain-containing protein n=1 Tax=Neogobius melanostomus TaxID=47308 RepID=A0A8C6T0W8_9GOBI